LTYFDSLTRSMTKLAQHPKTLFVGQGVKYDGQRMHQSFSGVPMEKRIEMPVGEEFQAGFCLGLALEGFIPVCVYPRMDFMLLAANQLVNHLDKIQGFKPKVIVRVAVGSTEPLNAGPQHTQDHTQAFRWMLKNTPVIWFDEKAYDEAMRMDGSVVVVERMEMY
jgi:pyruvate/2-oxoglutarate/acetoin dehydrogenase E1 component